MRRKDKPRKQRPKQNKIGMRGRNARGGRSVRQVSRDQWGLDERHEEGRKVRNRKTWARNPLNSVPRIVATIDPDKGE